MRWALAARERGRAAAERQVVQPDIDEERQAVADLADEVARDLLLVVDELQVAEEVERLASGQRPTWSIVNPRNRRGRRVVPEPRAHARDALDLAHHARELGGRGKRLGPPPRSPGTGPCIGTRTRAARPTPAP